MIALGRIISLIVLVEVHLLLQYVDAFLDILYLKLKVALVYVEMDFEQEKKNATMVVLEDV